MTGWIRRTGFLATGIALANLLACRQVAGIKNDPAAELVSTVCGLPYGTNACASCVNTSCCAESDACAQDTACSPYARCLGACNGDPECRSRCTVDHPGVASRNVSVLRACLASHCESACGLTCGSVADSISEPAAALSCESCIEGNAKVCADARAAGTSVEGDAYWRCVLACQTEDCRLACGMNDPDGVTAEAPFQADYAGACAASCGFGAYWACVGHVSWPPAKASTWKDTFKVVDSTSHMGVPGLDVSVCLNCPCDTPGSPVLAHARTDDAGVIAWMVPQVTNANGLGAGIGLDGCLEVTSPTMSYVPTFAYWGWPISEPVTDRSSSPNFVVNVLTQDAWAADQAMLGLKQDPARGWIGAIVFDCLGNLAPGVHVTTSDGDSAGITSFDFQPIGSEVEATTPGGVVIFFNVPPGLVTVSATPVALGTPSSQVTVNVAAGMETGLYMLPTPIR